MVLHDAWHAFCFTPCQYAGLDAVSYLRSYRSHEMVLVSAPAQTPYLYFIYQMMTNFRGRDMVLVECRHVYMSLCMHAKCPDVVCEAIKEIMQRNHWNTAAFVGHSYGTFVLSRMAQLHRDLVESMVSDPKHHT